MFGSQYVEDQLSGLEAFLRSGAGTACSASASAAVPDLASVLGIGPPIGDDSEVEADVLRGVASAAAEAMVELACEACEIEFGPDLELPGGDFGDPRDWHECLWRLLDQRGQRELEQRTGLRFLGIGAFRVVMRLCPGLVLKVAVCPDFTAMNAQEADVWVDARSGLRTLLVPPVELGEEGRWLIAEEAVASMDKLTDLTIRRPRAAEVMRVDPDLAMGIDMDWYNWGWHDGLLKLLDYGNG